MIIKSKSGGKSRKHVKLESDAKVVNWLSDQELKLKNLISQSRKVKVINASKLSWGAKYVNMID